ncbi:MAG: T9SS type A sorting domain-containing protein [Bacteroidota bacterium]|nr:T9SS type A sorting domain-containing protein [Bacteroidota bacterium]
MKIKLFLICTSAAIVFGLSIFFTTQINFSSADGTEEDIDARNKWMTAMLADPATGLIPEDIRNKELAFAATLPIANTSNKTGYNNWQNIGPWNVGGRTRALAIDIINENIILAAGVSGGIWKSTDGGKVWIRKTKPDQLPNVTCISQNPQKPNIWWAGTGEYTGNSASGGGAFFLGNGLYKSVDGGETWQTVAATVANSPNSFSKNMQMVLSVVHSSTDTSDHVFMATYGNIYRSTNGGKNFTFIRGGSGANGSSEYTDIAITSTGIIYAVLSSNGPQKGMWRSIDNGKTWANITPVSFYNQYERIAIGISPSDENQVYFVMHTINEGKKTLDFRGRAEYNGFWKYTYVSGDGTGAGGLWEDRSDNLPDVGGAFGNFNTQGGYDLYVRVKPDNANMVFIGCNNLWRSSDGFKTKNNTSAVGGYDIKSTLPDYKLYLNHHPDQHNWVFLKSDPKKAICANDGGIFRTDDCTANPVAWQDMNIGYLTTQYYTVAMDHAANGKTIIGGLQDNGTWWGNDVNNIRLKWTASFGGDGSYCYVPDGANDLYVSKQEGKVYHIQVDANGNATKYARIDPSEGTGYGFINPFICDPNKQNRMYIAGGTKVWRNNDVNQIALKTVLDSVKTMQGWEKLDSTFDTTMRISALTVSKQPANIVLYGTTAGKLYKMLDAHTGQPSPIEITGQNFPQNAYISCISIDPLDTSRIFVVFSNYNIQSVFYTNDGGQKWTAISGNLEQNANGSGNGPSCRWITMMRRNGFTGYFLATSTGLYVTDSLQGANTRWVLQAYDMINNNICTMIDVRESDGLVIVATHGNGLFATNFDNAWQLTGIAPKSNANTITLYPNPAQEYIIINLPNMPHKFVPIDIYNIQGQRVWTGTTLQQQTQVPCAHWPAGNYMIKIDMTDRREVLKMVKE